MTTATANLAGLLSELMRRRVELRARGGRLRLRPRSALTTTLIAEVEEHRFELLELLTANDPDTTHYSAHERRLLVECPADL